MNRNQLFFNVIRIEITFATSAVPNSGTCRAKLPNCPLPTNGIGGPSKNLKQHVSKKMKLNKSLLTAASALALATYANAGFINGGFETGDFTGWTLEHGINNGGTVTYSAGSAGHAYVIGPTTDLYSPFDTPFNGNYMARLNEYSPYADATRLSQTAAMLAGETDLYINWGAVLENPTDHSYTEQPYFDITIEKNGSVVANEFQNASQGTAGGWIAGTPSGPNSAQVYYNSGTFHLAGLVAGDVVKVILTAVDCSLTGHAGYAYLDGIGSVYVPPTGSVPDGGTTAMMLGLAFTGIAGLRRKFGV
jgi:hypothetical protein